MTTLDGEFFDSQRSLAEMLRGFIAHPEVLTRGSHAHALSLEVLSRYDKIASLSLPVCDVIVRRNVDKPSFADPCLHAILSDKRTVPVSVAKVVRAAMSSVHALKLAQRRPIDAKFEALRDAVRVDVQEYKRSQQVDADGMLKCALCARAVPFDDAHVDHNGVDCEFRHLVERFARESYASSVFDIDAKAFREFHSKHMILQISCPKCNLRKPKRPLSCK